ncbi:MgtC/SapB family protein [Xinfangfangia sp. D13-10-4-6]|uniref:MgtC/SapB family protein n=1 Tax=Pseudogemmobacter hezensis TaxID=2737662 RepID=UPI00155777FA|nr:MgtC/SapB family protein [Pseudogemmobacter hezensis]NPD15980.1 MgtC/SapB family protein [Pseudogemmobacter hezensis]
MDFEAIFQGFTDKDMMVPIVFSIISGILIGGERELQGKDAGLRTHTLVCFASCLLTLLGLRMAEWVAFLPEGTQIVSDMSRMPHAVITGVGFLGAGVIFRNGASVHGLTTAASLWLTAALGVIFGTDMIELGIIGLTCAIAILIALRLLQKALPSFKSIRIDVTAAGKSPASFDRLLATLRDHQVRLQSSGLKTSDQSTTLCLTVVGAVGAQVHDWMPLMDDILQIEGVADVAITPLEIE